MDIREDIDTAIKEHDHATLRQIAQREQKEETRMLLYLLADLVERDLGDLSRPRNQSRPSIRNSRLPRR